ncbi:DEAD/DEAH box helicase [Methylopila jiangsuensis]|uniref:DEAD-box ATP-dependent RNA helicase RhpA n=1 Tax=Methylopila jiangsuensis TaxID=586230 RepID=A0A9W6N2W2_9HYPH|nr:DEAD/DEAH box helicase [Methylopila jiangsuensis]MDR6285868.1 superfamily II DNA/RNA helicase [Methylopila jiangsuensis]GLK75626.1 DEAD/DEAH box helicase [Methylopila jiangsuensis]
MTFSELGLSPKVLAAVEASGYTQPTPIQAGAIPHVLAGRDVLGIAQTGTGKTASFTLPMLTKLEQGRARARMPRTLILEPTRELAAQVEENFVRYGQNHKISMALLIGGVSFGDQDAKLTRGVDVLIATPGRLLDHFERGRLLLTGIEILVIDEADRMLDMGFIPDIERICKLIPPSRQTLFFSATMPPEIQRLTQQFLRDPERVEVARASSANASITQLLVATEDDPAAKRETLRHVAQDQENFKNAIVFCNRKRDISVVQKSLDKHGFRVAALHGDMDQRARMAALESFKVGDVDLLVASDVAARGLDIPDVSHVINYDVPIHPEDYVHRIGRTGRAGRTGVAITLVAPSDGKHLDAIEKLTNAKIAWQGDALSGEALSDGSRSSGRRRSGGARRKDEPAEKTVAQVAPKDGARKGRSAADSKSSPPKTEARTKVAVQPAPAKPTPDVAPRGRRAPDDADNASVGFGEHLPAFLARPIRAKRS